MSKQSLLLVDGDTRSLRVLEVSLRKAGFSVTAAPTVKDALDKLELHTPDLIISETSFATDLDGFELRRRIRSSPDLAEIPFIFLTAETAIENKIRGLELGVDDYLTKPIYIKEIVTRINILLQKRQRRGFDDRKDGTRFAGRVTDMPVVDVIQTIEISRKSGVINFTGERGRQAAIYFREGRVIDAEAGTLQGEDAVYRLLTWNEGEFEVMFRTVRRREAITASSQGLLMEGMRRLDEWSRLLEQLPPLAHRFEVDAYELSIRLGEIPDDNNRILRLIDGKRSLIEVIDASDFGDLECLQTISRLYFEGMLIDLDPHERARRDTGKPMPLIQVDDAPTPIEEVASGPIHLSELQARSSRIPPAQPQPELEPAPAPEPDLEPTPVQAEFIEEETPIPGPLMGGYRQSSLMLIDAAVAAAEAIEPGLFDDDAPPTAEEPVAAVARVKLATRSSDPRILAARNLIERNSGEEHINGAVASGEIGGDHDQTQSMEADEPPEINEPPLADSYEVDEASSDPSKARRFAATIRRDEPAPKREEPEPVRDKPERAEVKRDEPAPKREEPDRVQVKREEAPKREESGLRMIGSLGRDRAEASGELAPISSSQSDAIGPQRELVTIMPRRNTREFPTVQVAEPAKAIEPVKLPPPPARTPVAGGVHRAQGPGSLARSLMVAATLLIGAAAYMKCHKKSAPAPSDGTGSASVVVPVPVPVPVDVGAVAVTSPPDAQVAMLEHRDAGAKHHVDAAVATAKPDASPRTNVVVAPPRDAGSAGTADKTKEARDLLDKAHDAVDDGDYEKALQLADSSLKLRKTARTYLVRAQALQRLNRIDDALKSIDGATDIIADYAAAWELRGMMLWSARRYDEARTAMNKYLQLDPNGKSAPAIRRLLEEPR
ncbi:MAG: response regulator receiver protein [Myxococcales bacterium]|nr:response regulator receiver protein [Myxococcales bacterium]